MNIGIKIKKLRTEKGMTLKELSEKKRTISWNSVSM